MTDTATPAGLEVLDVVEDSTACLRFVAVRNEARPDLELKSPADVTSDVARAPGEVIHLVDHADTLAARLLTVRDAANVGSTYLSVFTQGDPGEPLLGDLVELAMSRARALEVPDVRCSDIGDPGHLLALQSRHEFQEGTRWRRFELDVAMAPDEALLPPIVPGGLSTDTLLTRPDLSYAAFRTAHEGLLDAPGDFPRPEQSPETWLAALEESPVSDRGDVLILHDSRDVVFAVVQLELLASGSRHACLELLAVARQHRGRGMARLAKQLAGEHARQRGLLSVSALVHPDNEAMCATNISCGWTEGAPRRTVVRLAR